jgi:carboxypeptidase C (cathepsin A)
MPESPTPPPRQGNTTEHTLSLPQRTISYTATAEWQRLFEQEKPVAEMFHVAYVAQADPQSDPLVPRPMTFVFNGGPGAASAYLHMGALGPKRIAFDANGKLPRPPVRVVDNLESWLSFTDLVFIDPIGTGFSRSLPPEEKATPDPAPAKAKPEQSDKPQEMPFWEVDRDLNALGEFIQRFLSRHRRWLSPIYIAGESYGGFRVAKLARKLQQTFGIGLSGSILISPAMEFSFLYGNDYNLSSWATVIPSFAAAALHHGRAQGSPRTDPQSHRLAAEQFARTTLLPLLAMGDAISPADRQRAYQQLADLIGLPLSLVQRHGGRIGMEVFSRELLRDQHRIVGLYDASITAIDPFPDRLTYEGTDPTLDGFDRLFTGAINSHLRDTLGVHTELVYALLNLEVFHAWKFDPKGELKQGFLGAVDDLRIGMALNPYMRVLINHGFFDLVTPYFASNHLANLMKLDPEIRSNLILQHYEGGHMFYTWDISRQRWFAQMQAFYRQSPPAALE